MAKEPTTATAAAAAPAAPAAPAAAAPVVAEDSGTVGQIMTPELMAQLRKEIKAELSAAGRMDPTFSDPNPAVALDVGMHAMLTAGIARDLKDKPVPEGAVPMFSVVDLRVATESGHMFLFPANTVQHIPKFFVAVCRKAGAAVYEGE